MMSFFNQVIKATAQLPGEIFWGTVVVATALFAVQQQLADDSEQNTDFLNSLYDYLEENKTRDELDFSLTLDL